MRKKILGKKVLAGVLAFVLVLSALTGCQKKESVRVENEEQYADLDGLADDMKLTNAPAEELTLPISTEGIELSYFSMPESFITSKMKGYSEMTVHQEAEKLTGIKINWREESYTDPSQKMNLMFSTGETEDIVWDAHIHAAGGAKKLLDEELIVPLNKYIELYAPNLKKLILETPGLLEQISTDDGRIYCFPEIRLDPMTRVSSGFAIRKDWLERAGLDVPITINDWYNMLKTFQELDMNGNGKKDEIFVSLSRSKRSQAFTNFSIAFGIIDEFYVEDGVVKLGAYEPGYKDYLTEMEKWYREGLLDPEFSTQDSKQFNTKMTNDTGAAYYGSMAGNLGTFVVTREDDPTYDLIGVANPASTDDVVYATMNAFARMVPHGANICTSNEHIIETVKYLDFYYSEIGSTLFNWGIEGQSYEVIDGKKQFTDLITNNPDGLSLEEAGVRYAGGVISQMPIVEDPEVFLQIKSLPQQLQASSVWTAADQSKLLVITNLFFDNEEATENANILSEVNTYIDEMFNKYVMGIEPLDSFDEFQSRIKAMGIDQVLDSYQAAYDRMNK